MVNGNKGIGYYISSKGVSFMGVDYKGAPYVLFKQLAVSGLTAKINQFSLEKKQT